MTNFWQFSTRVSERLLSWSGFSIASGGWLLRSGRPFWRGVGLHFIVWGAIDAGIALLGLINTRRLHRQEQVDDPAIVAAEARKLRRLLWINSGLDMLYLLGGWWLYARKGAENKNWRGQGVGIIVQGGFLFLFDLWHALRAPSN